MSRLDGKRGRFNVNYETNEINSGLKSWGFSNVGDTVDWYRFRADLSEVHDVYDEGTGVGRVYDGPISIPVLHATHSEGANEDTDIGFYFTDDLHVTASYAVMRAAGFIDLDQNTYKYLKDRFVYDGKVFRVLHIQVLDQIQQRDIIVGIDASHVKPDEMVNDQQFARWNT
jgi:hypothetical protein